MAPTKNSESSLNTQTLPPELKTKIISFAMIPRIIEIKIDTTAWLGNSTKMKAGPVPPPLQVDSCTRKEMQRTYKLIKPSQPWSTSYNYINFDLNTIYITKYKVPLGATMRISTDVITNIYGFDVRSTIKHIALHDNVKYTFQQHFQKQIEELLVRHPRLKSLSLVYDNRRGDRKVSPEKYEFVAATGIANCISQHCPSGTHQPLQVSNEECMKYKYTTAITNFESTRTREDKPRELQEFWEANADWKRPKWEAVSIVKTRK